MFTTRDLLYKALDYDGFWNTSKQLLNSRPSKLRQLQLEKLLIGFGITKSNARPEPQIKGGFLIENVYIISGRSKQMNRTEYVKSLTNFEYFTRGEFISDKPPEKYQDLISSIISTSKAVFPEQSEAIDKEPVNLEFLFQDLYSFRLGVYHMWKYNFSEKRTKLFSTADSFALHLRNNFIASMEKAVSEVDEILCMMIDPDMKTLNKDEINYPIDDLEAIDEEWKNQRQQAD